jgi:hypothetical protein
MIQRVQTIWLLLASALILALFLFPYAQFTDANGVAHALKVNGHFSNVNGQVVQNEAFLLQMIFGVILSLIPLYIIIQFKNRSLQLRSIGLLALLLVAFGAWLLSTAFKAFEEAGQTFAFSQMGVGIVLLLVSLVFLWMAAQGVRKDIRLLKSADRLR